MNDFRVKLHALVYIASGGRINLTLSGVRRLGSMPGGTQSQLMLGSDGNPWVVKFTNNPQHPRILVNELIVGRIAQSIGLTVPQCGPIVVDQQTILRDTRLRIQLKNGRSERCADGVQFGSQYIGGYLRDSLANQVGLIQSRRVLNLGELLGMFVLDRWTGNRDRRQMLFKTLLDGKRVRAIFIDQGWCFGAGDWIFHADPLPWGTLRSILLDLAFNWTSFEPWITKIETFPPEMLWDIAASVPSAWYGNDRYSLEKLMENLLNRRSLIRWHTWRDWTYHRASVRNF
jgi:hypothetical protein